MSQAHPPKQPTANEQCLENGPCEASAISLSKYSFSLWSFASLKEASPKTKPMTTGEVHGHEKYNAIH